MHWLNAGIYQESEIVEGPDMGSVHLGGEVIHNLSVSSPL